MKYYEVRVADNKAEFVEELLRSLKGLDFIEISEVDALRLRNNCQHLAAMPQTTRAHKADEMPTDMQKLKEIIGNIDKMRTDRSK